jgi:hypothetical protein
MSNNEEFMNNIIKGIFLLILAVSGNFVAETLGCKTQKLISENMYAKHLVIILILYFAIGFTNTDEAKHPFVLLKMVMYVYALFLLFTKMDIRSTIIVFGLLSLSYVNSTFINYYKNISPDGEEETIELLGKIQKTLYVSMTAIIFIGFTLYYRKQYSEYYNTWSTSKFLFGVNKCKSMQ